MKKNRDTPLLNFRYRLELAGIYSITAILRIFPLQFSSWLVGKTWRAVAPLTKRHQRALGHLESAIPEYDEHKRERTICEMWECLGRVMVETFLLDRLSKRDDLFSFDTSEVSEAIQNGSGGYVVVSLHTGNWELSVIPAVRENIETCGVYQSLTNPYVDRFLCNLRTPLYTGGLFSKTYDTARNMVAAVRSGKIAAFLADQRDVRGVKVQFFGKAAYANPFPVMLARSCKVPLIACRTIRKDEGGFHFEAKFVDIPRDGDRKQDIAAGTQIVHDQFEKWIREYPSQWMWIHRKWAHADK
ncbi:MAG: lauroyl acyltransferase [Stappiaceae bacterium]